MKLSNMRKPSIAVLFTAAMGLHGLPAFAADTTPAARTSTAQPRLMTWEQLVPKNWDPMKEFKGMDLSKLEDGDPRANELLMKMQEVSNNAPTNAELDGVDIKIPGFIVPLEENKGELTEFLLVPYFGACIHTPPPPANQILHVRPRQGAKFRSMDTVWVTGKLQTRRNDSMMGVSGYSMTADSVTKYSAGK
ncbi:conserved exported hypothetical protein [Burkholderiales bacterium 8X]|nr:conserved exported hypothetical protein [Burkholderiales bacterium 8X]